MAEGLRRPDEGRVLLGDQDLTAHPGVARDRFGVQLQTTAFFDLLTVRETVDLFRSFYPVTLPTDSLIARLGLEDKRRARVQTLSGGQRQRLALAVALVNDPEVVFLDEPSAGLDPQARRNLWDIVLGLKAEGRTVVLTTHSMEEAEALSDRLAVIDRGRILDEGAPKELIGRHLPQSVIELAEDVPIPRDIVLPHLLRVEERDGLTRLVTERLEETLVGVVGWARERNVHLAGLRTRGSTLEDVFLHLTGRSLRE